MEQIVGEVLFDDITLVPETDNELMEAITAVNGHDMPQKRPSADHDHRFWSTIRLFGKAAAPSTGQNDRFHCIPLLSDPKRKYRAIWSVARAAASNIGPRSAATYHSVVQVTAASRSKSGIQANFACAFELSSARK